jgi:predicted N-acetyltransferase YhbS
MGAARAVKAEGFGFAPFAERDLIAITPVLDAAFGPGRLAKTSERVRERGAVFAPALSRAVYADGVLVGGCQMWRIQVGDAPCLFLGPLAVHPDVQRAGLGARLAQDCVTASAAAGERAVLLVGAPAFFAPLGFSQVPEGRIALPGPVDPRRLLWMALRAGGLEELAGPVSGFPAASPA